jgi:HD-GYP domain-containing protein (c-di-GMP phosphodiesterase class II)
MNTFAGTLDKVKRCDVMLFNVNELLISLSHTLDFAEKEVLRNNTNHGMRVSYISARIAQELGMSDRQMFDLISYALLHDNGVMGSLRKKSVPRQESVSSLEADPTHCIEGEKNLASFPFLAKQEDVILYHHENYDGSGFFGISGSRIPLYSRIIRLADCIAIRYSLGWTIDTVMDSILREARFFDPDLCEAAVKLSRNVEFWLGMDDMFVQNTLVSMLPQVSRELDYRQIRSISQIFSRIIDAKSPFTGSHSRGISEKTGFICQYYEFDEKTYWQMRIAADLHDLGKLAVPNSILDKPGKLTREEYKAIQSHPFYTRKILTMINGFEDITEWASNHHEKLNGSGYPFGLDASQLDFNSRILACVDIYQALTEDRPYRKGMPHSAAMKIMSEMVQHKLIEPSVTEDMNSIFRDL